MDIEAALKEDLGLTTPRRRVARIRKRITDARSKMSLEDIRAQDITQGSPALNAYLLLGGGKDILLAVIFLLWGIGQILSAAKVANTAASK